MGIVLAVWRVIVDVFSFWRKVCLFTTHLPPPRPSPNPSQSYGDCIMYSLLTPVKKLLSWYTSRNPAELWLDLLRNAEAFEDWEEAALHLDNLLGLDLWCAASSMPSTCYPRADRFPLAGEITQRPSTTTGDSSPSASIPSSPPARRITSSSSSTSSAPASFVISATLPPQSSTTAPSPAPSISSRSTSPRSPSRSRI